MSQGPKPTMKPQTFEIQNMEMKYSQFTYLERIKFFFMLPAFDAKGKRIHLNYFDKFDFGYIDFVKNGLHPKSYFSNLWDLCMSLLYFACLWLIPFLASYDLKTSAVEVLQIIITVIFASDTIIALLTPQPHTSSSYTSFREYESLRLKLTDWILKYLKIYLVFDVVSAIPFDLLITSANDYQILLLLLRLIQLYKIPAMISRCAFFIRAKLWIEERFGTGISKTLPIAVVIFYFIHFNACSTYYAGKKTGFVGWQSGWIDFNGATLFEFYTWTFFVVSVNVSA
ncbi:hypothetical protein HDU98_006394 [Podochytrium sp. JEL0797]|nr:hypothetical protein HDU98_006394 [Podochytrium sp. JEL0797]